MRVNVILKIDDLDGLVSGFDTATIKAYMKNIYLVLRNYYTGTESIHGAFATELLAQQYIDQFPCTDDDPLIIVKVDFASDNAENSATRLINNSEPLGSEFAKVLDDNRWNLYQND